MTVAGELYSLFWMLQRHASAEILNSRNLRLLLWSSPSRHASQLADTVTKYPLLVLNADKSHLTCFDALYVGPAARQLGGPGSKYVDSFSVRMFRQFVSNAFTAPDVVALPPITTTALSRVLVDVRATSRRITNADQFVQTLRRYFEYVCRTSSCLPLTDCCQCGN